MGSPESRVISLFNKTLPSPSLDLCVVVPVKDEAANLLKTLDALRNQKNPHGISLPKDKYEVLLLANNCTDHSFKIAKEYQKIHPEFALHVAEIFLPDERANIGTVRGMLMDEAYSRFSFSGKQKGIIASTDGDTVVDSKWMYHIIEEIAKGNDAVGGRIVIDDIDTPGAYHSLNETYKTLIAKTESMLDPLEHDPWPRHFQYFGASLAVTCDMYQAVGGLPQLPYLEDEAFHKALFRRDAKIRKSPAIKVRTSGRHEGRVRVGLSEQLKKWSLMETSMEPQMVACANEIIAGIKLRNKIRLCWNSGIKTGKYNNALLAAVAKELKTTASWLGHQIEKSSYFGELWEAIEHKMSANRWNKKWAPVPVTKAIADLSAFTRNYKSN